MSKTLAELNALCDVLSYMRTPTAFDSANQMYKHFCKPGAGTICVRYVKDHGKIFLVQFEYTTWLGARSELSVDTIKFH